ncbi:ISL3 family transposase [Agarivorans aestuarii]|uniref:ISL3 family transposase n=1 Tax=Agarivorans aestuarii TaxID=1563703 RepID=A0ABU7G216_9ALTE|nr:ISL3 family transposase [Agarivorans aestuarii]MEE1673241.1 ISL3 family transposase [Agarivorans aestuarii]
MQDTTLYQSILGLTHPWAVSSVELNESSQTIIVRVDYDRASLTACPTCGKAVRRHDTRRRFWRHLDTCQFETRIEAEVPRADCPEHGVQTLQVPWAASNSRYTELFETRVISMLKVSSLYAVSKTYRLSWGAIDRIMARGVQRGLTTRTTINCQDLLVDETAFKKGHDYVTVSSNRDGQVISVEDGRAGLSLFACFKALPPESTMHTRSISMDMSRAYINAAYDYFGERAKQMIAIDHFHIAKVLTKAVNEVRKSELINLPHHLRKECHQTRYGWLKRNSHLHGTLRERVNALAKMMQNTGLSWIFKEQARAIWYGHAANAKAAWDDWLALIEVSQIRPMMTAAETVKTHLNGIITAMRYKVSNGLAEAINGNIQRLKTRAMGFKNKERFKRAILFHFGGLDMTFHQER